MKLVLYIASMSGYNMMQFLEYSLLYLRFIDSLLVFASQYL